MKPHLKLSRGLWLCRSVGALVGIGWTPAEAYSDWRRQQHRDWRTKRLVSL